MGSIPSSAFASSRQAASPNASCRWRRREKVLHKRPNGAALPGLPRHRSPHRRSQGCARLGIALPARKKSGGFHRAADQLPDRGADGTDRDKELA
jgi:hypothetical protein